MKESCIPSRTLNRGQPRAHLDHRLQQVLFFVTVPFLPDPTLRSALRLDLELCLEGSCLSSSQQNGDLVGALP
jgi:hypothetical protein